jgi:catechol 2,3-dioxygenase-like lactoylglutathione lyase family enzyme
MTDAELTKLQSFSAVFPVRDVARSLDFFTGRLGFKQGFRQGEPVNYAGVERDAVSIHLKLASRESDAPGRSSIYVVAADVDALHDELLARDCAIEVPPTDFFYGMREMALRDVDGNHITFGQPTKLPAQTT